MFAEIRDKLNLKKEVQEVYLHSFLFKLAEGLVGIFIPLYIIQQGHGVSTVLAYFAIYYSSFRAYTIRIP